MTFGKGSLLLGEKIFQNVGKKTNILILKVHNRYREGLNMFRYNLFFIAQCTCTQKKMKIGLQPISIAFKDRGPGIHSSQSKNVGKIQLSIQ